MGLQLYLPIAGSSIHILFLLGLGGLVGFLSGLFGVGGGFLMTPLLIMLGIPPTVAAASDSNQIVAATASGTYAHYRLGNVDFKMGTFLLIGGLIGGTLGVQIIKVLRHMGNADFFIKITYVVVLGCVGGYMFVESLQQIRRAKRGRETSREVESITVRVLKGLPWQTRFEKSGVTLSPLMPLFLGGLMGILAAIMGLGGGFLMVPMMVYILRMPMHVVVGTNLFQEVFMCTNVTMMQSIMNHTVDLVLALVLLLGSTVGAQVGARLSTRLQADQLKILLASIILLVMLKMLVGLVVQPHLLLNYKGVH
jgi:uncharacterized membrane protein YfcA